MRLSFEEDFRMFRSLIFISILKTEAFSLLYWSYVGFISENTTKNQIFWINSIAVSCRQTDRVRSVRKACVQEAQYTHKTPIFRAKTTSHK